MHPPYLVSRFLFDLPEAWSKARDAFRPDAFQRARRAGAVKDAEGTAKRQEP